MPTPGKWRSAASRPASLPIDLPAGELHGDWLTVLVGSVSPGVLFRWKASNPVLIAATAWRD
jgi:hypothetical protein